MNGAQDLGGAQNFGSVVAEADEPVFHAEWERRVFALALAMGFTGTWTLDASRSVRESLPPAEYLAASYYEIWLRALQGQLVEHGLVTRYEMASGASSAEAKPVSRVLASDKVGPLFDAGFPSSRPESSKARFAIGDEVAARNVHPVGHTRLPRYVRGKRGTVERVHGVFVFPDDAARGDKTSAQWLYTVGFDSRELWGESGAAGDRISFEAFESYLLPVEDVR